MKKKIIRFTAVLLALVLLAAGGAVYQLFIFPRTDSSFLTFQPFSGKLFDLEPAELERITVREENNYDDVHSYTSPEDLEWAAGILNSFRYSYWVPDFREEKDWVPAGCYPRSITISKKPKYRFGKSEATGFSLHGDDRIFTVNTWFYCDTSQLDELFTRKDEPAALISELEADPAIREMIDGFVHYPQRWHDWYDSLPAQDSQSFCKLYVLTWIKLKSNLSEDERPADYIDFLYHPQDANYGKPTPEPPSDIREQIEKLENDPEIHELVDYYAPDPQRWWAWYESLPDEHEELVSKIYALKWVKGFSGHLGEPINLNYNIFLFAVGDEEFEPYNDDEYVYSYTQRREELESDPAIREMVDRYAPDPKEWWAWYETLPETSDTELSKIGALEWVELFSLQSEDGREGLYYDLLQLPAALAEEN